MWTGEITEACRFFIEVKDLSASQVAFKLNEKFGTFFTRNAVIGKSHREGFTFANKKNVAKVAKPPAQKITRAAKKPKPKPKPKPKEEVQIAAPIPRPMFVAIDRLERSGACDSIAAMPKRGACRWPTGDPKASDFHFCMEPCGMKNYCTHHHSLAYTRPMVRRPMAEDERNKRNQQMFLTKLKRDKNDRSRAP